MKNIGFGVLAALLLVVSMVFLGVATNGGPSGNGSAGPTTTPSTSVTAGGPDQRDADFLDALGGQVTSVSPYSAQLMGHRVCSALDEGASAADVRAILVQKGLTDAEASRVMLAAVAMYCNENHDKVNP
jgi:hypothetical protein